MHPVVVEALVLALMGLSGVAAGLLMGIRNWIALTLVALAASTTIRVWTAFATWSVGANQWLTESWIVASAVVLVAGLVPAWRHWRTALLASLSFGVASVVSLMTKYVFDIGERHHSDSAGSIALAVVAIGGEMDNVEALSRSEKRGIAYPLMIGLGPTGRLLAGFTPVVFLLTLLGVGWLAWIALGKQAKLAYFAGASIAIGAFSLSVPIFRASMFYLNAHTLMGFGILLMLAGVVIVRQTRHFDALPVALTVLGGIIGVTARIEGIVLVAVMIAALLGQLHTVSLTERIRLGAVIALIGGTLAWWQMALDTQVLSRFGLSGAVLLLASAIAGVAVSGPWFDPARRFLLPVLGIGLWTFLVVGLIVQGNPLGDLSGLWGNMGLGRGGWATAAYALIGSLIVLGLSRRSSLYRLLLAILVTLVAAVVFSKGFDGGDFGVNFGRESFYDSVNRMWLHIMPTVMVLALVGYTELLASWLRATAREPKPSTEQTREKIED